MTCPLGGVRVLELGSFITGPCAGMMLADLGATVIKIEQPKTGDPFRTFQGSLYSPQFCAYNARKQSLTLNLREARGIEVLLRLAKDADVLIENFRPGTADALGLGWPALRESNPRLVYCSITGFGADGPYAARPCYDTVAQAMSGYLSQFVDSRNPRIAGPAVADALTGIYAAYGILGALFERSHTGAGRRVEVAMLDSMMAFACEPFSGYFATGVLPEPQSRAAASQSFVFECSDGKFMAIHLSSPEKFWRNLLEALGRPDIGQDPRCDTRGKRVRSYAALGAELQAVFRTRERAAWAEALLAKDVPHAALATLDEVLDDPQVRHNQMVETVQHPSEGPVKRIRHPVLFDGDRGGPALPPPTLGEHTEQILVELGYAQADIDALRRDGVT